MGKYLAAILTSYVLLLFIGIGCAPTDSINPPQQTAPTYKVEKLSATQRLNRASMAIRGIRPSLKEFDDITKDPTKFEAIVRRYLNSQEFGKIIREIHAEWFLINVSPDYYPGAFPAIGPLQGVELHALNTSLIEAAPRLVEHVVLNNKPYHEIVTASYTMANEIVATVWGLPYDVQGKGGWKVTKYPKEQPTAGVLSDGFMFTRHASTSANRNRGRAQQVARIFLCVDYANRALDLKEKIDLSDEQKVRSAVRKNPTCNSCHQTLDPLASFFASHYPLRLPEQESSYPLRQYAPEFKDFFRTAKPAFFGKPGETIADLGKMIAKDPRFHHCMTKRFYAYLLDIDVEQVPRERVEYYARVFEESGFKAKELVKAIVLSDDFQARQVAPDENNQVAKEVVGFRRAKPYHLDSMYHDLTGFRWETFIQYDYNGVIGKVNLLTDSFFGYKLLGGGSDGYDVWKSMTTVNSTTILLLRAIAERAAPFVVSNDLQEKDHNKRRLLREVESTTKDEAAIRKQLASLHLRLFGAKHPPGSLAITNSWKLFQKVFQASSDPKRAWTVTLYAMLQDIKMLYY